MNYFIKFSLVLIATLAISSCGNEKDKTSTTISYAKTGTPAYGDMIVQANIAGATNLVPWLAGESASSEVTGHIYNSLLRYDANLSLEGELAKNWKVTENGKKITFHLHQNIKWEDGKLLTAHDVMASFNAITNPITRTPYAGDYLLVEQAKIEDDYTFSVTYKEPFSPALSSWAGLAILPKHILDLDEDINETRLKTKPMGSGPYILKKWNPMQEVVLRANPNYFEGRPNIEYIRTRVIPDLDTQFLELKSGRLDSMNLKPVQFTRLTNKQEFTNKFDKYSYLGFGYTYMGFNLKNPMFADKLVRQALSYATPRQQLVDGVLMGKGQAIASIFKPETWAHNKNLKPYEYNLQKAKELLKQAGWEDSDKDGILDKEGKPFKFTLITNQGNDQRIKTATILQQSWKQLGIEVKIQVQEWRTFLENTLYPRTFQAFILGWSLTPEPDPYDIWHSSKQKPREFNIIGFENKEADELMEQARRTFDRTERKALLARFQEILHEEQPTILLYAPESLTAIHKRIKGIKPAPAGISYNFKDWYVPLKQQMYKQTNITP